MKELLLNHIYQLCDEEGHVLAEIDFPFVKEKTIEITHTVVDPSLQGQGIAGKLVKKVIELAEENDWTITASCSYAIHYFEKFPHPRYH